MLKNGNIYGLLKSFIMIKNRISTLAELIGDNNTRTRWCKICFKNINNTFKSVENHFLKYNKEKINCPITEKTFTILIAHNFVPNIDDKIKDQYKNDLNNLVNLAKPELTDCDIDEVVDQIYTSMVKEQIIEEENELKQNDIIIKENIHQESNKETHNNNNIREIYDLETKIINKQKRNKKKRLLRSTPTLEEIEINERNDVDKIKHKKTLKCMDWYRKYLKRKNLIVKMPRLNKEQRNMIKDSIPNLFKDELIPLMKQYNLENIDQDITEELKWKAQIGVIEECIHRIRQHIMIKLDKNLTWLYSKPKKINIPKSNLELIECQKNTRNLNKIQAIIEDITLNKEEISENVKKSLINKLQKYILNLSEERRMDCFNTLSPLEIIDKLLNDIDFSNKSIEWLIKEIETSVQKELNLNSKNIDDNIFIQSYTDNPKNTMKNMIWNKASPRCDIDLDTLEQYFRESFNKNIVDFDKKDNNVFKLDKYINDDLNEEIINELLDKKEIMKILKSRKWDSAPGPDGLSYAPFKLGQKHAVKFLRLIFKNIIHFKRIPDSWKTADMKLLYKKGEKDNPRNWRPLSIANSIYRIFSCSITNIISKLNFKYNFYSEEQRGFIKNRDGCFDNNITIQELFADAKRNSKDLIITTLDFRNAFGSVPHKLIKNVMKQIGFPKLLVTLIMECYKGATTRISTYKGFSKDIDILKGTNQGCPMSPLLFNLCLEPFIKGIKKLFKNESYMIKINENKKIYFSIQLYADDILLIANSKIGMERMLNFATQFCDYSKMILEPAKSMTFAYVLLNRRRTILSDNFNLNGIDIPKASLEQTVNYLGAPITARKIIKLKTANDIFQELKLKLSKIIESKLLITQKINAIQTFLIPKLEFKFINSQLSIKALTRMDQNIRQAINTLIGAKLPISFFHAKW